MTTMGKRQSFLPIPVIPEHTEYLEAGAITIGVGYRLLTNEIIDAYLAKVGYARPKTVNYQADDGGVSIFVFSKEGEEYKEHLRLDCFDREPHYHYVFQKENAQDRVHLDPVVTGDAMAWAFWCLTHRLPDVLRHVGQPELAAKVDVKRIEAVLPEVRAAVKRSEERYIKATGKQAIFNR
jgi:hypothetical protein